MRAAIGLILLVVGMGVAVYGIGSALLELTGLYESALTDPLNAPADQEEVASREMIRSVIIGGLGIPPTLLGSIMFYGWLRARRKARRRHARSAPGAGGW
jgi:hypothetical protein